MDLNLRFQEKAVRSVSVRQLSRRTAALLDEILDDGGAVLVSRYGQPVALLAPLEEARNDREAARSIARAEETRSLPDLDPLQRKVLESVVAEFPYDWNPNDPWITRDVRTKVYVAMTKLEFAGCIEKGRLGVRATPLGKRVCAARSTDWSAT